MVTYLSLSVKFTIIFYLQRFCNFFKHGSCYQFVDFCSLFEIISYEMPSVWDRPDILLGSFEQFCSQFRNSFGIGSLQLRSLLDDFSNLLGKVTSVFDEIFEIFKSRVSVFWGCPVQHQAGPSGGLVLARHLTLPAHSRLVYYFNKEKLEISYYVLPVRICLPRAGLAKW